MESAHKIFIKVGGRLVPVSSKTCLHSALNHPEYICLERSISDNVSTISPSRMPHFSYIRQKGTEVLDGILLRHKEDGCPGLDPKLLGTYSPRLCICIMVKHDRKFLVTQRSLNISFPGAWVLPGGGIEAGELIQDAGKREVKQQVGLDIQLDMTRSKPMLWESFYVLGDNIKRSNLVLYFQSDYKTPGEVKVQESEVISYKWKPLHEQQQDEIVYDGTPGTGYGQGHLVYFRLLRQLYNAPGSSSSL